MTHQQAVNGLTDASPMPTWRRIWIAQLLMNDNVGSKLGSKHGVDANYIRRYVEGNPKLLAIDRTDDVHGTRTFLVIPYSKKI